MNLFQLFKSNKSSFSERLHHAETMGGRTPSYSLFGDNVMNDETVNSIAWRIINEYSKLTPKQIRTSNGSLVPVADNRINELLKFQMIMNRFQTS